MFKHLNMTVLNGHLHVNTFPNLTFEIIAAFLTEEVDQNGQFPMLPKCFQNYSKMCISMLCDPDADCMSEAS